MNTILNVFNYNIINSETEYQAKAKPSPANFTPLYSDASLHLFTLSSLIMLDLVLHSDVQIFDDLRRKMIMSR